MLLAARCIEEDLLENKNPERATDILGLVNRHTLGQLLKHLKNYTQSLDALEDLLLRALEQRNGLFHSFYRKHNFRRNSDEGRALMLEDLEAIHVVLLDAYKAIMNLSGVDLGGMTGIEPPKRHVPI